MLITLTTMSGAHYTFNETDMTWRREHATIDLRWPSRPNDPGVPHGTLADWPTVVLGRGLMFDDIEQGTIFTTPVMQAKLVK